MIVMKFLLVFIISLFTLSGSFSQKKKDAGFSRQEMPFYKYGFERNNYNDGGFEFLMGNGEMGGRVHYNGLGLEKLWFSDYWKNPRQREFLPGVMLVNETMQSATPSAYKSSLDIDKAICYTQAVYDNQVKYKAELFFSFADDHFIGLKVYNLSSAALDFSLLLPAEGFIIQKINANKLSGTNNSGNEYNKASWAIRSSRMLTETKGKWGVTIPAGSGAEFFYSVTTQYDVEQHQQLALVTIDRYKNYEAATVAHQNAWKNIRRKIASVILPESEYALSLIHI
jgi:hypothetical protein